MQSLYNILHQIQTDTAAALPALLVAAGLTDFSEYVVGPSREHDTSALCIYSDEVQHDDTANRITLIIQLQLSGVTFANAVKYADVVHAYFRGYEPSRLGMSLLDGISIDTWPMDNTRMTFVFFNISYSEPLDSCDEGE